MYKNNPTAPDFLGAVIFFEVFMNIARNHIDRHRSFYRMMISITIPIALQNLIVFSVSMMDTLMLGHVGSAQLSACSQANQPAFIFQMLVFGLVGGGTVLTAQYWGKGDIQKVNTVIGIVLRVCIITSVLLTVIVLAFPDKIMHIYLKYETAEDIYIVNEAVSYLKIVGISYVFWGISLSFSGMLRSVEVVKISVIASLVSCITNVFFNWIFIFGNLGSQALGIRGAALGTLIARIVEFAIISSYVLFADKRLSFKLKYIFKRNKVLFGDFIKYSSPVVTNELMWALAISIQAAVLGKLSNTILAANSIAMVIQQLATIVAMGIASAGCVIVGKRIGEGNIERARKDGSILMNWSVVIGIFGMIMVILLRRPFISLYTQIDESTRQLALQQMIITSVIVFFQTVNVCSIVGVLRGAGDTKFAMMIEIIALWCLALPAGLISGFVIKAPILVTYALLKSDEFVKAFISFIRTKQKGAYRSVTRDI